MLNYKMQKWLSKFLIKCKIQITTWIFKTKVITCQKIKQITIQTITQTVTYTQLPQKILILITINKITELKTIAQTA